MHNYTGLIFLLLPLFLLYTVFARTRRQQRAFATVQAGLQPGQRVMTTSGVHARVNSVEDGGIVVLEIAPGVHTRWARAAIAEVFDSETVVDLTGTDTDLTRTEATRTEAASADVSPTEHAGTQPNRTDQTEADHERDDRTLT